MNTWVQNFITYAETAVTRVTVVTDRDSLANARIQEVEQAVTPGLSKPELPQESGQKVTDGSGQMTRGIPQEPNEYALVTGVTGVTGTSHPANDKEHYDYLIEERASILEYQAGLTRDEAETLAKASIVWVPHIGP
jgi:hypothetical protein